MGQEALDHPELRALRQKLGLLELDENRIRSAITSLARDIVGVKEDVAARQESLTRLYDNYNNLRGVKITALNEFWQIKLLIVSNRDMLVKQQDRLADKQKRAGELTDKLNGIVKAKESLVSAIDNWGQVYRIYEKDDQEPQ